MKRKLVICVTAFFMMSLGISASASTMVSDTQETLSDPIAFYAQDESEFNWDAFYDNAKIESYDMSGVVLSSKSVEAPNLNMRSASDIALCSNTTVKLLPSDEKNAEELMQMAGAIQRGRSTQGNYREMAEKTGLGKLYMNVYWNEQWSLKGTKVNLLYVTGGYTGPALSGGCHITSWGLTLGQTGWGVDGVFREQSQSCSVAYGGFTAYPNASWVQVYKSRCTVGANFIIRIARGSSSWSTELNVNI